MTTNNLSSVNVQRSQSAHALGVPDHELWSNGHRLGIHSAAYPSMNYVNAFPPTRYSNGIEYEDPPYLATGSIDQQVNQSQRQLDGDRTPGLTQYIPMPVAPGPPWLEQHALAIPEIHNDRPPFGNHVPLPHNVAGLSRGHPSFERTEMSAAEDLKYLASRYLHNLDSSVDKLRMRRSRSGIVRVFILLEIDGTAIYEVPNDGPTCGNTSLVRSRMSVADDLKNLASHYLHNPSSHVDKLRMRRSRSGAVKVIILLEIDDSDAM